MNRVSAYTSDYFEVINNRRNDVAPDDLRLIVAEIIGKVKAQGDTALCDYTKQFDKFELTPQQIRVTDKELNVEIDAELQTALEQATGNIREYHEKQLRKEWFYKNKSGAELGEIIRPVRRAGLYIPAGTAPLISTVLMTVIPAQVAGVKEICVVSPPNKDGNINSGIIAACKLCGIDEIYRVGSAWSIAALAFGTNSIKKVDVIAGPGNRFVTEAKRQLYGYVGIDLIAGPSESLILIDDTAEPDFVAADILSQAEHAESRTFLVSPSASAINSVEEAINKFVSDTLTDNALKAAVTDRLTCVLVDSYDDAAKVSNDIAPEHLQIITKCNDSVLKQINNAGAVFLGSYSPVPLGDFCAGPSHVLPTAAAARFMSGLSTDNFVKRMGVIEYTQESFGEVAETIITIGEKEQLPAHKFTASVRKS